MGYTDINEYEFLRDMWWYFYDVRMLVGLIVVKTLMDSQCILFLRWKGTALAMATGPLATGPLTHWPVG